MPDAHTIINIFTCHKLGISLYYSSKLLKIINLLSKSYQTYSSFFHMQIWKFVLIANNYREILVEIPMIYLTISVFFKYLISVKWIAVLLRTYVSFKHFLPPVIRVTQKEFIVRYARPIFSPLRPHWLL